MKTQTMLELIFPGALFPKEETVEVNSRDFDSARIPDGAFAFQFYDLITQSATCEDGTIIEHERVENRSVKYFPNAQLFDLSQIESMGDEFRILASNMRSNDWPQVIRTRRGNFQPFEAGKTELVVLK